MHLHCSLLTFWWSAPKIFPQTFPHVSKLSCTVDMSLCGVEVSGVWKLLHSTPTCYLVRGVTQTWTFPSLIYSIYGSVWGEVRGVVVSHYRLRSDSHTSYITSMCGGCAWVCVPVPEFLTVHTHTHTHTGEGAAPTRVENGPGWRGETDTVWACVVSVFFCSL